MKHTHNPALDTAQHPEAHPDLPIKDRTLQQRSESFVYAGIGARATPPAILAHITKLADSLGRAGWHLNSGGADGADTAFANGAPVTEQTLFLPWRSYNGHHGTHCQVLSSDQMKACLAIASQMHPAWNRCSAAVRKLHARNVATLLGPSLTRPVNAVICWTENGAITGGTGMALRIAAHYRIPVLNLARLTPQEILEQLL